jgi:hypothetical protein
MMNDATLKQMAVVKAIVRRLYKTAHPYERTVSDQRFLPAYFNIVVSYGNVEPAISSNYSV